MTKLISSEFIQTILNKTNLAQEYVKQEKSKKGRTAAKVQISLIYILFLFDRR